MLRDQRCHFTVFDPLPGWPQLTLMGWETVKRGYGHWVGFRSPGEATIHISLGGMGTLRVGWEGTPRPIPPGTALVFDSGQHPDLIYEVDPASPTWEFLWLSFRGQSGLVLVDGLVERHGNLIPFPIAHPLIRHWQGQLGSPTETYCLRTISAAESTLLVGEFLRVLATEGTRSGLGTDSLAQRAIRILGDTWNDPPSVQALAATLRVSREHLIRTFRAQTGTTPATWLRRYRIQRVADLLSGDDRPIREIADLAGFSSSAHLVTSFREVFGETPAVYRRRRGSDRGSGGLEGRASQRGPEPNAL